MYKQLTLENIDTEHICCAMSSKDSGITLKKEYLKEKIKDGLVFNKLDERGKVFIEYLPAEVAYAPIEANNYLFINCFWVSGKFKKQGHGANLLKQCLEDAKLKNKDGVVVVSSAKKAPFLSDGNYLKAKGFKIADSANPHFELLYYPFNEKATNIPKFKASCKTGTIDKLGWTIYYTVQCPFAKKYAIQLKEENPTDNIELIELKTTAQAQNASCPFTAYSIFYNGQFITNEIVVTKKFLKLKESLIK